MDTNEKLWRAIMLNAIRSGWEAVAFERVGSVVVGDAVSHSIAMPLEKGS